MGSQYWGRRYWGRTATGVGSWGRKGVCILASAEARRGGVIGPVPFRREATGGPLRLLGSNIDQLPVHTKLRNSAYKAP